ncbi:MAG: OmpA family protein [Bacteroidetes bacterium]|nr:OmpA family protein [Bacteroidota bacterium]
MKKNNIRFCLLISLMFLGVTSGFSQKALIRKAAQTNENLEYIKTIDVLQKVADKGYKSEDLFKRLGDAHYFNNQMEEAQKWYGELMQINENTDPEYYFRYAQSLKGVENYTEAAKWMQKFANAKSEDARAQNYLDNTNFLEAIPDYSEKTPIYNLGINTVFSDFGASFHNGELVYASARGEGPRFGWNNQPFLDLYTGKRYEQTQNNFSEALELPGKINTRFHESSAVFPSDGNTIYFTRNNYNRGRLRKDDEKFSNLKIYKAIFDGTEWTDVISLPINSDDFNTSHPALTPDEKYLIFSSDRPGSLGSADIYFAAINPDGTFGEPQPLGQGINTQGRETFPFVDENYNLYFATDGHPGLGGLDIFKVENIKPLIENSNAQVSITNIGKPFNSPFDDFAYVSNPAEGMGYFSSDRPGGTGDDDIYTFALLCDVVVNGMVVDADSGLAISGASLEVFDANGKSLEKKGLGRDGLFELPGDCEDLFVVRATHPDYVGNEVRVSLADFSSENILKIPLQKDKSALEPGLDLAKILDLNPIYFDFDKSKIRPDAEIELQKIIAAMEQYPQLNIDVRSHTDSRGNDAYNLKLSERRNQATIDYIINVGGIEANRLSGKGYGETQLTNACANGVACSKEDHQLNRRSEFIILDK